MLDQAVQAAGIPQDSIAVWIAPAGKTEPIVSLNAEKRMQPASIIKVVTTAAALDLLKPDYYWHTDFTAKHSPDKKGVVRGMGIRGTGDPHLMIERVWIIAQKLKSLGVRRIEGNIRLDRTAFDVEKIDQAAFDGEGTRTYNVGPDPLMVNLKTVSLTITPVKGTNTARVRATPELYGVRFPESVRMTKGRCADWKSKLKVRFGSDGRVRFSGAYPSSCGEKMWHMAQWSSDDYFTRVFKKVLVDQGIAWKGRAVSGNVSEDEYLLLREYSEPFPLIIHWINKYSSNPMARQLFLTLSAADAQETGPATLDKSRRVVSRWLDNAVGIAPSTVFVDNGSGLSRQAHVTARSLGRILEYMYRSFAMPEFMASLPAVGYDGTMRRRRLSGGSAHVKTGHLNNVRSIAGYVTDDHGNRYSIVVIVNHEKMNEAEKLLQKILNWVAAGSITDGKGDSSGRAIEGLSIHFDGEPL